MAESKGPAAFTVEVTDEEEVTAASFMKALKARDPPLPAVAVSIVLALTLKQSKSIKTIIILLDMKLTSVYSRVPNRRHGSKKSNMAL